MKNIKKRHAGETSLQVARRLSRVALEKKAEELLILDVREKCSFADYFVIMSGRSTRHTQGLSEAVEKELSLKRITSTNTEGYQEGVWILLDFNDVIVHIFYHEMREFFDLEGLWHAAPRVEVDGGEEEE